MRDTLKGMCSEQMGPGFEPYILGACPFAHRRRLPPPSLSLGAHSGGTRRAPARSDDG